VKRSTTEAHAFLIRRVAGIAVVALVLVGTALASRPATLTELYWMGVRNFSTGGRSDVWARVSTSDRHYAVVFTKPCSYAAARCTSYTHPAHVYLLRRARLTVPSWADSLVAHAQLRPADRRDIVRLCRVTPKPVRRDLLAAVCKS
jgi:hypothetical protein